MAQNIKPHQITLCGALIVFLACTACGSTDNAVIETPQHSTPAPIGPEQIAGLPEATTYGAIANATPDPNPQSTTSGKVLHPKHDVAVYDVPNGKPIAKLPALQVGSPTWAPVIAEHDDWMQILLPSRPNAASGWVRSSAQDTVAAEDDYRITVDLAAYRLTLFKQDKQIDTWTVGTGKREFPTPKGRAYVMSLIKETVNTYSPYILALSAHSDAHTTFGGGPGTVGIHGWPDDSHLGKPDSDGCIRVSKAALNQLITVPIGTVVDIR